MYYICNVILTKREIIEIVANDTRYLKCCQKWVKRGDLYKDLYQFIMLSVCEMDENKLQVIYEGNIYSYVTRMIWLNAVSKTAPFYRYNKQIGDVELTNDTRHSMNYEIVLDEENEELENEELLDHIELFLKSEVEYWESKGKEDKTLAVKLLGRYTELGNYRQLAREADIPYSTVRYTIKTLLEKINEDITSNYKRANRA